MNDNQKRYLYRLCRLCLHESEFFHDIFEKTEMREYMVADLIVKLLDPQVAIDDGYPRVVCSDCLKKLNTFDLMSKYRDFSVSPSFVLFKDQYLIAKSTLDYAISQDEKSPPSGQHSPVSAGHSPLTLNLEDIGLEDEDTPMKLKADDVLEGVARVLRGIKRKQTELLVENLRTTRSKAKIKDGSEDGGRSCAVEEDADDSSDVPRVSESEENESERSETEDESCNQGSDNKAKIKDGSKKSRSRGTVEEDEESSDVPELSESEENESESNKSEERSSNLGFNIKMEQSPLKLKSEEINLEEEEFERRGDLDIKWFCKGSDEMEGNPSWGSFAKTRGHFRNSIDALKKHRIPDKRKRMFECDICGRKCDTKKGMGIHTRWHMRGRGMVENGVERNCTGGPRTRSGGTRAMKSVGDLVKHFECDDCGSVFRLRWELLKHVVIHTGMKKFRCRLCGRTFAHQRNLRHHLRIHSGLKRFACNDCGKEFYDRTSLNTHRTTHSSEKPFSCARCEKCFSRPALLRFHERIHDGYKPVECKTCGARFTQRSDLTKHHVVHTREKNFPCGICRKRFAHKRNLKVHEKIHTEVKKFSCTGCLRRFRQLSNLKAHFSRGCKGEKESKEKNTRKRKKTKKFTLKVKIEG